MTRRYHRDGEPVTMTDAAAPTALTRRPVARWPTPAWLVGGAVRDRLLERPTTDFDVVVEGDAEPVARAVGRAADGHAFELSEAFGAWRIVARDRSWQLDVLGLPAGTTIER